MNKIDKIVTNVGELGTKIQRVGDNLDSFLVQNKIDNEKRDSTIGCLDKRVKTIETQEIKRAVILYIISGFLGFFTSLLLIIAAWALPKILESLF